ncbi:MAG: pyridoxamine 5'-phosphate oxidase family protein [Candidatus Brachytrichaceae bacterium NZ_4S206]|jgi:DNA-binding IclR family transcriptional regulator
MAGYSDSSTLERALLLLEFLLDHPDGAEVADLLEHLDGARSTLFLLLNKLKSLGYVEQTERRGRYRPGPRLLAWRGGALRLPAADLLPAFFQEAQTCGLEETLALFIPAGDGAVVLLGQVEGRREVRSAFESGQRLNASSAPAQVLLFPVEADVRRRGYALSQRGDALDVALPICRDGAAPNAALVMTLPAFRWDERTSQQTLPVLREMSARLSYRLGALHYAPWHTEATRLSETYPLDEAEIASLLKAPWAARLACVSPDGAPHVVPVWHEWDGAAFHVVAWKGSRWGAYLLLNPQVSLTVDEPFLPLRRVSARGSARAAYSVGDPGLNRLLARLSRRYLGQDLAASLVPQIERSFIIQPSALRGWKGIV